MSFLNHIMSFLCKCFPFFMCFLFSTLRSNILNKVDFRIFVLEKLDQSTLRENLKLKGIFLDPSKNQKVLSADKLE